MIQILIKILTIVTVAKFISLVILIFLPKDGVEQSIETNFTPKYHRISFKNMLDSSKYKQIETKKTTYGAGIVLKNMILKGLYGSNSNGFAIIALKSKPDETSIISVGKDFQGYELKNILKQNIILVKNSKEYILKIKKSKSKDNATIDYVKKKETIQDIDKNNISKKDINYYMSNPKHIWKDISIVQLKDKSGFKITRIKKGSKMDRLGLKKGDVIIKANNIELTSIKNVMKLYKNIKDITAMEIVVLRNNTEVELMYEID
ncbi:MAG: PDZ domain-containing protein [Campylobacterales bacterium]